MDLGVLGFDLEQNPSSWRNPLFLSRSSNDGVRPAHAGAAVIQSLRRAQLFAAPWTAARRASLSFTIFQSLLRLMSVESTVPSNCLILLSPPSPPALNLSYIYEG